VRRALERIDWEQARGDVSPFLEPRQDVDLVSEGVLVPLLR